MGIKNLTKLLQAVAPSAIKEVPIKSFLGRTIAFDGSMCIYQFLVAVRSAGEGSMPAAMLMNEAGEVTSHLQGFFSRTIRLMEQGLKPVFIFDGKPPTMKGGELAKRSEAKAKAKEDLKKATEAGNAEEMDRLSKRTVHMTKSHKEESMELLRLMGVPVFEAPCEAEAQCAELAKAGKVWAAASEDMDTLTFGTPRLVRRLTFSESRNQGKVMVFDLEAALQEAELSMDEFIDVCMLSGCDYLPPIRGIGSKKALNLIKKHGNIEAALQALHANPKIDVPAEYNHAEARELFVTPEVADAATIDVKLRSPDEEKLIDYLVNKKGFSEARVRSSIARLNKARKVGSQRRMDAFFGGGGAKAKAKTKTTLGKKDPKPANKAKPAAKAKPEPAAAAGGAAPAANEPEAQPKPVAKKPAPAKKPITPATAAFFNLGARKPAAKRRTPPASDSKEEDDGEVEVVVPRSTAAAAGAGDSKEEEEQEQPGQAEGKEEEQEQVGAGDAEESPAKKPSPKRMKHASGSLLVDEDSSDDEA